MRNLLNASLVLSLLFLGGCNEYTSQICNQATLLDVPGLEGNHKVVATNQETLDIETIPVKLTRTHVGTYKDIDGAIVYTCSNGGRTLMETVNSQFGTFSSYFLKRSDTGFDLVLAGFDKNELDKAGIPYEIVETNRISSFLTEHDSKQKVLRVNNGAMSNPWAVAAYLKPMSLSFKLY